MNRLAKLIIVAFCFLVSCAKEEQPTIFACTGTQNEYKVGVACKNGDKPMDPNSTCDGPGQGGVDYFLCRKYQTPVNNP